MDLRSWLSSGVDAIEDWQAAFGSFERAPSGRAGDERFAVAFGELTRRQRDNYPFFHLIGAPARVAERSGWVCTGSGWLAIRSADATSAYALSRGRLLGQGLRREAVQVELPRRSAVGSSAGSRPRVPRN